LSEDSELERLKAKRLAEMQQNISSRKEVEESTNNSHQKKQSNPETFLLNVLDSEV